jgi:tetratricopeptide (TPR) repeat protein
VRAAAAAGQRRQPQSHGVVRPDRPDEGGARVTEAASPDGGVYEALARALYDAGRYNDAVVAFTALTGLNPTDDYAQFGLGLSASRAGELRLAAEHLSLAVAMRPDLGHYARALRRVRALQAVESA